MEKKDKRTFKLEKVVLSIGGTGEKLDKGHKLLQYLTKGNPTKTKSRKRIPSLGVKPGLEIGSVITIRKNPGEFLKKLLVAIDNTLRKKQISKNNFSFGIEEYIEIPGIEYQRELGMLGFDVTVTFKRPGRRVKLRKIKRGRIPQRQIITPEEIIKYMEEHFQTKFI